MSDAAAMGWGSENVNCSNTFWGADRWWWLCDTSRPLDVFFVMRAFGAIAHWTQVASVVALVLGAIVLATLTLSQYMQRQPQYGPRPIMVTLCGIALTVLAALLAAHGRLFRLSFNSLDSP